MPNIITNSYKIFEESLLIFLLAIVYNVINSIYVASLYHFKTTGEVSGGYSEETIRNAGLSRRSRD